LTDNLSATGDWPFQPGQQVVVQYQSQGRVQQAKFKLSDVGDIIEPLVSIKISDDDRDWIAWTPRGYYAASSGGDRLIGWQENQGRDRAARFHFADQFRDLFDRPDIVRLTVEHADLDEAIRLANKDIPKPPPVIDLRQDMAELRPPMVKIIEPADGAKLFAQPTILVRAEITVYEGAPLRDVSFQVNGRTYLSRNIVLAPADGRGATAGGRAAESTCRPGRIGSRSAPGVRPSGDPTTRSR
jgi:hypothetical protein